jgi:hypothetical protein
MNLRWTRPTFALFCILLTMFAPAPAHSQSSTQPTCTFPAQTNVCRSPNGRWLIRWQEATESSPHLLFVELSGSKRPVKLLTFNRHIEAVWAPDAAHVAITDHSGSSESDLFVAELRSGSLVNVEQEMRRTLKSLPPIYENGHRYFSALRWQSATRLIFEVRAYDAEPGKEQRATFTFDLKSRTVTSISPE